MRKSMRKLSFALLLPFLLANSPAPGPESFFDHTMNDVTFSTNPEMDADGKYTVNVDNYNSHYAIAEISCQTSPDERYDSPLQGDLKAFILPGRTATYHSAFSTEQLSARGIKDSDYQIVKPYSFSTKEVTEKIDENNQTYFSIHLEGKITNEMENVSYTLGAYINRENVLIGDTTYISILPGKKKRIDCTIDSYLDLRESLTFILTANNPYYTKLAEKNDPGNIATIMAIVAAAIVVTATIGGVTWIATSKKLKNKKKN
ncbi:MAG TPA: hypothetical protein DEA32_02285 [Firmicutes bacterium]|nr:hypothetical protein [Bacillota bacterium]